MITSVTAQMRGILKLLRENSIHYKELSITFHMDYEGLPEVSEHDLAGRGQRNTEAYQRMEKALMKIGVAKKFERKYESIRVISPRRITPIKTASGRLINPDVLQLTIADGGTDYIYRVLMDQEISGGPYAQILRPSFIVFEKNLSEQVKGMPRINELLKQYGYSHSISGEMLPSILEKEL